MRGAAGPRFFWRELSSDPSVASFRSYSLASPSSSLRVLFRRSLWTTVPMCRMRSPFFDPFSFLLSLLYLFSPLFLLSYFFSFSLPPTTAPIRRTWSSPEAGSMGRGDRKAVAALIPSSQPPNRSSPNRHVRPADKVEGDISPTLCTPGSYPPTASPTRVSLMFLQLSRPPTPLS